MRAGHKGITFVFDLAFTNAAIMWEWLHRATSSRCELETSFNKVIALSIVGKAPNSLLCARLCRLPFASSGRIPSWRVSQFGSADHHRCA